QWWKARPTRRDAGVAPEQRWLFPGRIDRQATTVRYLSRYTHRVAISNRRLIAADHAGVAFRWKDYRIDGPGRWKTMRLHPHEFIRRFLMHVLPKGFHRIRHYGLFASANRAENIATARARRPARRRPTTAAGYHTGRAACAALPMPELRRPHDRHRGLRARLRAKVAAEPKHDRHIMSQTSSQRRRFPVPLRWLHAGGDLSLSASRPPMHTRPLIRSSARRDALLTLSPAPCVQACGSRRPSVAPPSELGANLKSP